MLPRRRSEYYRHRRAMEWQRLIEFIRTPAFLIGMVVITLLFIVMVVWNSQKTGGQSENIQPTVGGPTQPAGTDVPGVISVNVAYELYMSNSAYFLDVRERSEWDEFHIPSTTLLPLSQVAALADKFPRDKPVILISASDNRSLQARDILKGAGFNNVTSMAGGIIFWRSQGYPIEP